VTVNSKKELAGMIDHMPLSAMAGEDDIRRLCDEAVEHGFCAVCVKRQWVSLAADILCGTAVKVCGVAEFTLNTDSKAAQVKRLIMAGADEVEVPVDFASIESGDEDCLRKDFSEALKVCRSMRPAVTLKVIIESPLITIEQVQFVCQIADRASVDFVGVGVEFVAEIAQTYPVCKIKAVGEIRTADEAIKIIEAGVSRIGCINSVEITEGFNGC
jgi:deoxyribose-phosphate aldolase